MSGGISVRHVRIGSPNMRAMPRMRESVRGDREPERACADDRGIDASTSLNLVVPVPASFGQMRARDYGFVVGQLPTGPANAITDVPGVRVGHANAVPDHTGVTAVWPHAGDPWHDSYFCATAALNGAGELTGTHDDRGVGLRGDAGLPDGHVLRRRRVRRRDAHR